MKQLIIIYLLFLFLNLPASADEGKPEFCAKYAEDSVSEIHTQKDHDSIPYGRGLLWDIEAPSGARSYLFGTMHSQDRRVNRLPPIVRLSLVNSQKLVMEVVPDRQASEVFNEMIYFQDDSRLSDMLDAGIYQRVETLLPEYGIAKEKVNEVKPWAAFTLLGRPKPVRAPTQDAKIQQLATSSGIPVVGIESMQELLSALDNLPEGDQVEILNNTICNRREILQGALDLLHLYVDRDLAGIVLLNEQPHYDEAVFDRFMQSILYRRNQIMLERIQSHLDTGQAFIAVGASHLPDKMGLLSRLADLGYKLTRVY